MVQRFTRTRIVPTAIDFDAASSNGSCDVQDSKECQKSHWPEHKGPCKENVQQNEELLAQTGIPNAYSDLVNWMEFYATPMKNSLIAALNLPEHPHHERVSILMAIKFGKVEMGDAFYGVGMCMIVAEFAGPNIVRPVYKCFSFDKTVARAKVMDGD
ncbi:hypothetical protein C0995_007703 [Termitomyces sp. Mi166|nr:hypothetical protein C0995_007703 [Termitomyces sp. Mi166\